MIEIYNIEREVYSNPWSWDNFLSEFENPVSEIYVFVENDEIAGYIVIWNFEKEVEIANIAVAKKFQGRGIGRKLLEFVIENKVGATFYLEVETTNKPAINLYTKFGFVIYGKRVDYYGPNRDAFLMKLKKGVKYA